MKKPLWCYGYRPKRTLVRPLRKGNRLRTRQLMRKLGQVGIKLGYWGPAGFHFYYGPESCLVAVGADWSDSFVADGGTDAS